MSSEDYIDKAVIYKYFLTSLPHSTERKINFLGSNFHLAQVHSEWQPKVTSCDHQVVNYRGNICTHEDFIENVLPTKCKFRDDNNMLIGRNLDVILN